MEGGILKGAKKTELETSREVWIVGLQINCQTTRMENLTELKNVISAIAANINE